MPGKWIFRPDSCVPLAKNSFKAQRRWNSTLEAGRTLIGDDLGPTRADAHSTSRIRNDGRAKALPLPPLLDPVILEERSQWEQTKKRPKFADFTPFQKKLWQNSFAHALASPVRQCRATFLLLPTALLISLHPRPHPTTSDPWLLPVSLATDKKHLGPPYRIINRQFLVTQLRKKRAWRSGLNQRFGEKLGASSIGKMIWREDMSDLILELMRKRLVEKLSWHFGTLGRLTPVASPRPQDIHKVEDVSCVLLFGSLRTRAEDVQDRLDLIKEEIDTQITSYLKEIAQKIDPHASPKVTHHSPSWYLEPLVPRLQPRLQFPELEFESTTWRTTKIPMYSLTDLLGEEKARALITGSKYEKNTCVVIKRAKHNVPVEILLMQLQSYIALPRS